MPSPSSVGLPPADPPSNPARPVKLSLPLEYQQSLFHELRAEDELLILARGLGLLRLVVNLLHSYDAVVGSNLVLVVGAEERENLWIGEALAEHAVVSASPAARGLTVVNTDLTSVGAREKMYAAGGVFSVTSRILVVDLLTGLLNAAAVTGVVVLHADRVVATSLEAFILRVYRQKNRPGFLKAFSDNPEPFTAGFAPLAKMMRNLFLRKVSLWPRFQVAVARSLEGRKRAEVIELDVPMTESMRVIQNAIMECVEVSIQELKKANTGVDLADWTLDSSLHHNFDLVIRRQLEPNWHRISPKTRQIVADLTVLRGLLAAILTFDSVSFMQHLDTVHAAHAPPPGSIRQTEAPWLFLDAAQTIFETARCRVYASAARIPSGGANPSAVAADKELESLSPVLEELPKWAILADVLEEIDRTLHFEPPPRDDSNNTVLIMCSGAETCRQLRDYLQTMHLQAKPRPHQDSSRNTAAAPNVENDGDDGDDNVHKPSGGFMMRRKLQAYLRWKRQFATVNAALFVENQRALSIAADHRPGQPLGDSPLSRGRLPPNKRRRVRGGGVGVGVGVGAGDRGTDGLSLTRRAPNGSLAQFFEKPGEVAHLLSEVRAAAEEEQRERERTDAAEGRDPLDHMEDYFQLYDMADLVVVHAYDGDQDEHVLEEVKPRHVVMYEPDAAFIRRVEVYRSSHHDRAVRVYFMYYGGSVEEQRYLVAVRREKDAFTTLIQERAAMSIVLDDSISGIGPGAGDDKAEDVFLRTVNSRIAGRGRLAATAQPPRVVVDLREFRSSLPSLLHGRSMLIVPCMLTVGDYVLSPHICVERKSVSDLVSSLRDGRLYAQAEAMLAHYRCAALLIEFDRDRSFTLEPFANLSGAAASLSAARAGLPDLQAKLVLLTLAFPALRIIWSSSPHQTAAIFESLKAQEPEPDPVVAVRRGLDPDDPDSCSTAAAAVADRALAPEPRAMLAAVPGVTPVLAARLAARVENLQELANMTEDELEAMVGLDTARKIYAFFNRNVVEEE